jgi:colanic acid biosynthesis protein WcaH
MLIPEDIYRVVKQTMPIPCVDLVVLNRAGHVLLLKRANHPARGQWWFPGGRVHFLEDRQAAALRKLREECNLDAKAMTELGSFDLIMAGSGEEPPSHGITTVFLMQVEDATTLRLDLQSTAADWRVPHAWQAETLHPFVAGALRRVPAHETGVPA